MIYIKSRREIELMREAGRIVAQAHELIREAIEPGITTRELDRIAEEHILGKDAIPAFKGYSEGRFHHQSVGRHNTDSGDELHERI